jgi:hypothetical protein
MTAVASEAIWPRIVSLILSAPYVPHALGLGDTEMGRLHQRNRPPSVLARHSSPGQNSRPRARASRLTGAERAEFVAEILYSGVAGYGHMGKSVVSHRARLI